MITLAPPLSPTGTRTRNRAIAGYLELLTRRCDPSPETQKLIRDHYAEKAEDFKKCELLNHYRVELGAQGSNSTGTVTPPLNRPGGAVDLDMLVIVHALHSYLEPKDLHRRVGIHLEGYYKPRVEKLRLGWTIDYSDEGRFHFDVIPVVPWDHPDVGRILAATLPAKNSYKPTNPRGFAERFLATAAKLPVISEDLEYFSAINEQIMLANRAHELIVEPLLPEDVVLKKPLQRITQLTKLFRDLWFSKRQALDRRTPSIILTTLLLLGYECRVAGKTFASIVDVLETIVISLTDEAFLRIESTASGRKFYLWNPTVPDENLVARWNEDGGEKRADEFFAWAKELQNYVRQLRALEGTHRLQAHLESGLGPDRTRPVFEEVARSLNPESKRLPIVFDSSDGLKRGVPAVGVIAASSHTFHGIP